MPRAHRQLKQPFTLIVAALLIALSLLASLQYTWLAQLSAGERERLQASLQLGVERFSEEANREVARAYLSLQMEVETLVNQDWERYAQRYDRWQSGAPYPELVETIYLVQVNQIGRLSLMRYEPAQRRFVISNEWPFELMPLRREFERAYRNLRSLDAERFASQDLPLLFAPAPAVVAEVARSWTLLGASESTIDADLLFSELILPSAPGRCLSCETNRTNPPLFAHTVILLDREYLDTTFFPTLAETYLPPGQSAAFRLAVVNPEDPNQLLYRSDPQFMPLVGGPPDARANVLNLSYGDLNRMLMAGEFYFNSPPEAGRQRITIGIIGNDEERPAASADGWEVVIRHRAGSLDLAVQNLQLRNMAISFGTLLLLGGSASLLIVATRRAERLARQQLAFASAVSHELRSPLSVIRSAGENLADGLIDDPQRARRYGHVIAAEGRRLSEMVDQVLDFASVQAGQRAYQRQPVQIEAVIADAIQAVRALAEEQQVAIESEIALGLPTIAGDASALRRAIQNLLTNALKYAHDGRTIRISAAAAAFEHHNELIISVHDQGPGISAEDLPYIFSPFYRGRNADQASGSGLGLSLVEHTVHGHGGYVTVQSQIGSGSRFTLHLPLPRHPRRVAPLMPGVEP